MSCNLYVIYLFILIFSVPFRNGLEFNVWGPGLKPQMVMPARYFFVETIPKNSSVDLDVIIGGQTSSRRPCRLWTNVLDRKDGSFIVRYKLYEPCSSLQISIKNENLEVGGSPFVFQETVHSENCNCNLINIPEFIDMWECGRIPKQIESDLSLFDAIDFDKIRDSIISSYNSPGAISLCHYIIKNNLVYRKCYGQHVGFKTFMDSILLSLARKVYLPDIEMFVNLGDWPLVSDFTQKFPIFAWCGSTDSFDIVMPTYDITESTLENLGRVMLDMLSVQGNVKEPWQNRIPKVFWRGRDASRERLKLIEISRQHPELFNASLTNFFFFRDEMDKYGPTSPHVSFYEFFNYKYQINMDGTVAAYRFPYLLAGGSLVFKQDSKYYEHFYNELRANVHYIPVKRDLSNLIEKVKWAMDNDEQAQKIAEYGRKFANENLLPKNIFCYYVQLLAEYSKKIISPVRVLEDMELVKDEKAKECSCQQEIKEEL